MELGSDLVILGIPTSDELVAFVMNYFSGVLSILDKLLVEVLDLLVVI